LFKPGFSTAEAVTDLSGRGVGMDVVKTNIEKLGGKIEIFTVLGKGTTFRLLLPLTLAIIPSLIVEAERQKFALPQINVQEIVRIKANDPGRKIELINQAEVLRLRGRLLPIVRLSDVLGLQRTYLDPTTGEYKADKRDRIFHLSRKAELMEKKDPLAATEDERRGYKLTNIVRIIVIKIGSRRMGLSVDTIFGSEEILVKTLPAHIKGCNNYSGVTILGDGKVAMILDPSGIIENANLRYMDNQFDMKSKLLISEAEKMRELQSLLLFKCSGPEILAIDMAMVSRVEEIQLEDINLIGDKEYIKFRGEPLRIIRPENHISIQKQTTKHTETSKYYVIIPKLVKYPMGILMEKVQDTIQASINLNGNDSLTSKGLVGSTILNDRIVLLINIYELFELANPEQYVVEPAKQLRGPIKILLVEDTPFFQKLEKDYLENAGYDVTVADNGKIALQILQKSKFDLIVSDINMPEVDGLELVRRIRADSELCNLPVIAVTSLTGEQQKQEGLAAGFDAYEFKLDRSKLIEVLEETLQKKR
jgi:two-component system, chemotaxis family, sensor kinase CheA